LIVRSRQAANAPPASPVKIRRSASRCASSARSSMRKPNSRFFSITLPLKWMMSTTARSRPIFTVPKWPSRISQVSTPSQ